MLEIKNLRLSHNGNATIDNLNLQVGEARIHGILGGNGAGKTSLANLIMGITYPDGGSIVFEGQDITHSTISERAKLGITLAWQEPARFEGLSVEEYLGIGGNLNPSDIARYLRMAELPPSEYLTRAVDTSLSGGERKRVELASVMAMKPKLAILDEPDSGIDAISLPHMLKRIREMSKQGSAVLLITHSKEAIKVADEVSIMCVGKVINSGPPREMCRWFKSHCQTCLHIGRPDYEGTQR